jgi:O-antigen ligase
MGTTEVRSEARLVTSAGLIAGALFVLALGIVTGVSAFGAAAFVVVVTVLVVPRWAYLSWPQLMAWLLLIILFIPIRRYTIPMNLPFELEPYRGFVALLILGWFASLLADPRTRFRRTGFEAPLALIVATALVSIVANPGRVAQLSTEVEKALMFFASFVLVVYLTASVVRRLDEIDFLVKTLVAGGAVVAGFAIVEARTGINVFNHLTQVIPVLRADNSATGELVRFGAGKARVFGPAQHPIALSAALVMIAPLAVYLARRYRQRRWMLCALALAVGCASTISRTGIMMFVVVGLIFLWLRPQETRRLWPALLLAPVVIHFVLPGTLGAIRHSFFPAGGVLAEQKSMPGASGSGRLADVGPALDEWKREPLVGVGFGTRVVDPDIRGPRANILDNQWLGTLLETGALGILGWVWFFTRAIRRFGAEAKRDDSARGWLLASLTAGVAAYGVGMLTFDAFSFIQVTFLLFILVGLGSAVMATRPVPLPVSGSG